MPTSWPQVEERIRPILDVMVQESEFQPPAGSQLRQSWISGAREYAETVGVDSGLVRKAIRYMRERELIIKSPRSLIAVALHMKHTPDADSPASRQRYAESLEKWGVDNDDSL